MGTFLLILGLILFIGLVIIHELGHYWAARRGGVEVEEFGIFFPPRLFKRKLKNGVDFTINALPLGGFVKLKGEHDSDRQKGSYGAAKTSTKVKIMLAGVFMNLVVALGLFTILALIGMPKLIDNQFTIKSDTKVIKNEVLIGYVEPGSPAAKAGLHDRDRLISITDNGCDLGATCVTVEADGQEIKSASDLPKITKQFAGQTRFVHYMRNGNHQTAKVTFLSKAVVEASKKTDNPKGYLGIVPSEFSLQRSTWSAPVVAVGLSVQLTGLTFQGLGHALAGLGGIIAGTVTGNGQARHNAQTAASEQVSGPVGIYAVLQSGSALGFQFMLFIIAIISLTLAIMNVLPIPALDGGRMFVTIISRLFKKQISQKAEEAIYATGFAVLMLLIIIISIVDVKRFF